MFRPGYKEPTTSSTSQEFKAFLTEIGYDIFQVVDRHALEHKAEAQQYRHGGYQRTTYPDVEALSVGMSAVFALLWAAVDEIIQAEERIEFMDDVEDDTEERQHAMGELFAAKSIFISLYKRVPNLERERLQATREGKSQRGFLQRVTRGEGDPSGEPIFIDSLDAGRITTGVISAKLLHPSLYTTNANSPITFNP